MRYDFSRIPSVRKRRYAGGGDLSAVSSGISQIAQSTSNLAQIRDTSSVEDAINDVNETKFDESGYDNLLSGWDSVRRLKTNWTGKELRGLSKGQVAGGIFSAANAGAGAGASVGGPWGAAIGGAVGLASGIFGNAAGNRAARRKARKLNEAAKEANQNVINNFGYSTNKVAQKAAESAQKNFVAMGGPLHLYSGETGGSSFLSGLGGKFGDFFKNNTGIGKAASAKYTGDNAGSQMTGAILQQAAKVGMQQGNALMSYAKPQKALNPYTGMVSRKAYKPELESDSDKFKRKMGLVTGLVAPIFDTSGSSKDVKIPDTTQQTKDWNSAEAKLQRKKDMDDIENKKPQASFISGSTYKPKFQGIQQPEQWSNPYDTGWKNPQLIGTEGFGQYGKAEGGNLRDKGGMLNEGEVYDLTPNEIARLKKQGYRFEYV